MAKRTKQDAELDRELTEAMVEFEDDPLGYVMFNWNWAGDPSIRVVRWDDPSNPNFEFFQPYLEFYGVDCGPDRWAIEFLEQVGLEVRKREFDGINAAEPIRMATASGHGIGKSCLTAWLIKWILDTRPSAKGIVTAGTDNQLRTKTWAEVNKWHKKSLTSHWFEYNSSRGNMSLVHVSDKEWRCDALTCREENSEAFAGQHSAGSTSFYIFDEASVVPDKIYEVRDGGTVIGEPMVFDFGNPTRNTGRFFEECQGKLRHRYIHRQIDSRMVSITNKELHKEWIDDFGIDSDYVKVRILGEFPSAGSAQFIPTEDVRTAQQRATPTHMELRQSPLLIGVDVARFGDDNTVIYPRWGNDARSYERVELRGADTVQVTGAVVQMFRDFEAKGVRPAMIFVDGTGVGGGVVDQLFHLGYPVTEVQFGSKPIDPAYRYKSDEIWGRMRADIKRGLVLPDDRDPDGPQIFRDLTQREFGFTTMGNKINLEQKKDYKDRVGESPNWGDALAVTYAEDLAEGFSTLANADQGPQFVEHDYDPYE